MTTETQEGVWIPESLKAGLRIGVRVRIRLSPECPVYPPENPTAAQQHYHDKTTNGTTGVIISLHVPKLSARVHGSDLINVHCYRVRKDKDGLSVFSSLEESFAATELIPLDDDAPAVQP